MTNQTPSSADWLDVIIKDLVTGVISWNNYGSSKAMDYENEAKQAIEAHIKQVEVEVLEKPNQLLRSAMQVAKRKGVKTNWEALENKLRIELEREHRIMYPGMLDSTRPLTKEGDK